MCSVKGGSETLHPLKIQNWILINNNMRKAVLAMDFNLVKTDSFYNKPLDVYTNGEKEFFMTREQIGQALEYADPRKAIAKIHERHVDRLDKLSCLMSLEKRKESPNRRLHVKSGGLQNTFVYTLRGCLEICRWSEQPKANVFMDKVWDIMEEVFSGKKKVRELTPAEDEMYKAMANVLRTTKRLVVDMGKLCQYCGANNFTSYYKKSETGEEIPIGTCGKNGADYTVYTRDEIIYKNLKISEKPLLVPINKNKAVFHMNEVCELLGVSKAAVYAFVERGQLKVIRGSKKLLFPKHAIEEFLGGSL